MMKVRSSPSELWHSSQQIVLLISANHSTCVTPDRSILNRLTDQLPVEIALTKPFVRISSRIIFVISNDSRRVDACENSPR